MNFDRSKMNSSLGQKTGEANSAGAFQVFAAFFARTQGMIPPPGHKVQISSFNLHPMKP